MTRFFLLASVFCFFVLSVPAQGVLTLRDKEFVYSPKPDTAVLNPLQKSPLYKELSPVQREFFYWVNVFRKDPNAFYKSAVKAFLIQFPEANSSEARSLEQDLKKLKPLPLLMPDMGLNKMAASHAADLGKRGGIISHVSSDGKDYGKRFMAAGPYRFGAENIYSGTADALQALIILLIDYQVPDKGHRINLSDAKFNLMGVGISTINKNQMVIVQEFGCK